MSTSRAEVLESLARRLAVALGPSLREVPKPLGESTLLRLRAGQPVSRQTIQRVVRIGSDVARQRLYAAGLNVPNGDVRACEAYLNLGPSRELLEASPAQVTRRCAVCGEALRGRQRGYCSAAHRQSAYRHRGGGQTSVRQETA